MIGSVRSGISVDRRGQQGVSIRWGSDFTQTRSVLLFVHLNRREYLLLLRTPGFALPTGCLQLGKLDIRAMEPYVPYQVMNFWER